MKRALLAIVVVMGFAALVISSYQPTAAQVAIPSQNPLTTLNTVSLNFTIAQVNPDEGNQVIRAFVPTGSRSVNCLASMNEIGTNGPLTGIALFCGEREPAAFGGVPGMLVSVFLPQPPPPDFVMSVTLYQQGAKAYGAPRLCTGADGC